MNNSLRVQCPAKINLDLKVLGTDEKGYHNISSIMQTINLFDYLDITLTNSNEIVLSGTSDEIPYDEKNICYKAAKLFSEKINKNFGVRIRIEKNIPVCAGLAGGSTNASGVLFALNKLFDNVLSNEQIHNLASKLGSDLNFCLEGSAKLCTSRGEKLEDAQYKEFDLCLIKPKNLKISAKEAYCAFDELKTKSTFKNDLEFALIDKYEELKYLHSLGCQMSGSGPTYFILKPQIDFEIDTEKYQVFENLKSVNHGVKLI